MPRVSVLMPVFNTSRYLPNAVESILGQTLEDFEFIIIDDGSTDGSLKLLDEYARRDDRIRLFSRENRGLVPTLNEGLELVRAEYIARMDSDDISIRNRLGLQCRFLDENLHVGAVGGRVILTDAEDLPIMESAKVTGHSEIDSQHLAGKGGSIYHAATMFRTSLLKSLNGFREEFWPAEDWDLFLRIAEVSNLANLHDVVYRYRQHPSNICNTNYARNHAAIIRSIEAACQRRNLANESSFDGAKTAESEKISRSDLHIKWAWWALSNGNVRTARKHALLGWSKSPFNVSGLRVLVCAIRGR